LTLLEERLGVREDSVELTGVSGAVGSLREPDAAGGARAAISVGEGRGGVRGRA
jgi:hypothetical protein